MSENSFSTSDNSSEISIDRRVSFRDTVEGKISLQSTSHYQQPADFDRECPMLVTHVSDEKRW